MTTISDSLRTALASRYSLERELGRGGMATVYLARDIRHRRELAVKVFRAEVTASIGVERFLREIEIAAQLQHPHILTLIDSGQADGFLFYVMPYVAGDNLRTLLDRLGVLEPQVALDLVRETADALDYAHRRGLVHRDIKPENILLSEGHAVVADFGIARAVSAASGPRITRTGVPIGTPGYMSPEQAAGIMELGPRSDVFSLAAVTYEMLVGEPPGRWLTEEAVRLGMFRDATAAHRARLDRLPGGAEQVLVKALAVIEAQRFAGPLEFARALDATFGDRPRPRYAEPLVRQIVNRAAELEVAADDPGPGLTIGGVQRLAAEVGIPPEHVQRAAAELASTKALVSSPGNPSRLMGTTLGRTLERVVPGEVDPALYSSLAQEMSVTMGHQGLASTLGRDLRWRLVTVGEMPRDVTVTIAPEHGETRILIEEKNEDIRDGWALGMLVGGGVIGSLIWGGISASVFHSLGVGVAGIAAVLGGCFVAMRAGFRNHKRSRETQLAGLLDQLAQLVTRRDAALPGMQPGAGRALPEPKPARTPP